MNDTDEAIEQSEHVIAESLGKLDDAGIQAAAYPLTDDEPYREDEIVGEIKGHTDAPVEVLSV